MWAQHRWSHAVAMVLAYLLVFCSTLASAKKNKTVHIVFSNHLVSCKPAIIHVALRDRDTFAAEINMSLYAAGYWI